MPVLTPAASEITSDSRYRERFRARKEIEQGLLLDRINAACCDLTIHEAIQGTVSVFSDRANPPLILSDSTEMIAQMAFNLIIREFLIKHSFFHDQHRYIIWAWEYQSSDQV